MPWRSASAYLRIASAQAHAAAPRGPQPAHRFGQLAAPGAHEARDAEDLAAPEREGDALHALAVGDVVDLQQRLGRLGQRGARRVVVAEVAAHHAAHQLVGRGARERAAVHVAPVAQHGGAVAVGEDLGHAVADVDDADALRLEVVQHAEQRGRLELGERGRGLVEDQHLAVERERLGDLHQLLARDAEFVDARGRVDVLAEPAQHLGGARVEAAVVHEGAAARVDLGHEDVLGDGGVAAQRDLLVHQADAQPHGMGRAVDAHIQAVERDRALVGLVDAVDDVHQRGLAGAVLAAQGVDLAGTQREVHARERARSAEALADAAQREQRLRVVAHSPIPLVPRRARYLSQ